jgi:hypothetical protein
VVKILLQKYIIFLNIFECSIIYFYKYKIGIKILKRIE